MGRDPFAVIADFETYLEAQRVVDGLRQQQQEWQRMSLLNAARSGFFSSDRAVSEYAERIWQARSVPVEMSCPIDDRPADLLPASSLQ